jgi:hypothetical protein
VHKGAGGAYRNRKSPVKTGEMCKESCRIDLKLQMKAFDIAQYFEFVTQDYMKNRYGV